MSTLQLYGQFASNISGGTTAGAGAGGTPIDYLSDTIKCSLHTVTYVPAVDTDDFFNDATNELGTANGYTAGGITIAGKTVTYTAAGGINTYDMDDTTVKWDVVTGNIVFQIAVFYKSTGTGTTSPLIGWIDCGAQTITPGNSFTITTGASGLFTGTVTGA
jgi:hypothetical protein